MNFCGILLLLDLDEDLILGQDEDLLSSQDTDLIIGQEEDFLLGQEEDRLLVGWPVPAAASSGCLLSAAGPAASFFATPSWSPRRSPPFFGTPPPSPPVNFPAAAPSDRGGF